MKKIESSIYDLVIITPSFYSEKLTSFVNHKNSYGVRTILATLEHIYESSFGRDHAEKIKYYIKHIVEELGIRYVL